MGAGWGGGWKVKPAMSNSSPLLPGHLQQQQIPSTLCQVLPCTFHSTLPGALSTYMFGVASAESRTASSDFYPSNLARKTIMLALLSSH